MKRQSGSFSRLSVGKTLRQLLRISAIRLYPGIKLGRQNVRIAIFYRFQLGPCGLGSIDGGIRLFAPLALLFLDCCEQSLATGECGFLGFSLGFLLRLALLKSLVTIIKL